MNKLRVPFSRYFCVILPLMVSCSTPPPPAINTPPSAVKTSPVTPAASTSAAAQAPKFSSFASSSSKPSAPKIISSSSQAVIAKPAMAISTTSSAAQSSSIPATKITAERNQTESAPVDTGKTRISGSVVLLDKVGEKLSPESVIINLEPVADTANNETPASIKPTQFRIDMRNKTYLPRLLAVKQNDLVSFSNKDNIKHNTFSSSGENTFDLGTFGPGTTQSAKLVAPGIVKVYCNIHPEMATFISVSKHNYSFITLADGKFSIGDLPPGRYTLTAWHIRGEVQQTIDLTKAPLTNYVVTINTSAFVPTPHKNKFGEDYKVKPALFNDEFY